MIHVQMSEDNPFHVARPNAERAQLRPNFLFMLDSKRNLPAAIGMKNVPGFELVGSLASVDDDHKR